MRRYNQQPGVSSSKSENIVRISNAVSSSRTLSMSAGRQTHFLEPMQYPTKGRIKWFKKFRNIEDAKERATVTVEVAIKAAGRTKLTEIKTFKAPLPEVKKLDVDTIANGSPEEIVDALLDGVGMERMMSVAKSIYSGEE